MLPTSHPVRAIALAIAAAAPALGGCTTTTNIVPDQLPIVTEAAARNPKEAVDVVSFEAVPVRLEGRLDVVSISMIGWGKAYDRFEAPVASRISGPWLIVQDQEKGRVYALSQITSVRVQRYDTSGAYAGGVALTVTGVVLAVGGTILCGIAAPINSPGSLIFGPQMIAAGIGVGAGGIPLIVASKRVNDRIPASMRQGAALDAGPGGLRVRF